MGGSKHLFPKNGTNIFFQKTEIILDTAICPLSGKSVCGRGFLDDNESSSVQVAAVAALELSDESS
jgi:hypothetical protein